MGKGNEHDKTLLDKTVQAAEDYNTAKVDTQTFFAKHKTIVIICGAVLALVILVLAIL